MKKILLISFLLLNYAIINAQSIIPVKGTVDYNKSLRPCVMVTLDPETKTLKKAWVKFLRKEYNFKLKGTGWFSNKDILYAKEIVIGQLSAKQLDFYTQIIEDDTLSEMKVFASFGYDIYINEEEYPTEFRKVNEMLNSFLKQYLPKYYYTQIKASSKKVKTLKKEIGSLKKEITKNNKNIENHTKNVEKLTIDVEDNSKKLNSAEKELKNREEKLEVIKTKLKTL